MFSEDVVGLVEEMGFQTVVEPSLTVTKNEVPVGK